MTLSAPGNGVLGTLGCAVSLSAIAFSSQAYAADDLQPPARAIDRSEEHTSELQSQ